MKKAVILVLLAVLLTGCASSSKRQHCDFDFNLKQQPCDWKPFPGRAP